MGLALSAWEIQLVSPFIEAFTLFIWLMVEYSKLNNYYIVRLIEMITLKSYLNPNS